MIAKIKATGKVIKVTLNKCAIPVSGCGATSVYEGDDGKTYFDTELDFVHAYPDWQQVRIQASIAAMQGFYASNDIVNIARSDVKGMKEFIAELAVEQADALIEELKKTI